MLCVLSAKIFFIIFCGNALVCVITTNFHVIPLNFCHNFMLRTNPDFSFCLDARDNITMYS